MDENENIDVITEETMEELSDGKGDDDEQQQIDILYKIVPQLQQATKRQDNKNHTALHGRQFDN